MQMKRKHIFRMVCLGLMLIMPLISNKVVNATGNKADSVAILNQGYTTKSPSYDFAAISMQNDAAQDQNERISVDQENLVIYLNGNSVVFEADNSNTAIYFDDNRDGTADSNTPAYVGDLTNYTVYGAYGAVVNTPISLTMNSGNIKTLYGCYDSTLAPEQDVLKIHIKDGTIGTLYAFDSSTSQGTMNLIIDKLNLVSAVKIKPGSSTLKGYAYRSADTQYFDGVYTLTEDCSAPTVHLYDNAVLTISKNVTLSATSVLNRRPESKTVVEGTLNAVKLGSIYNFKGVVLMEEGGQLSPLSGNSKWSNVYYAIDTSSNVKNTALTYTSGYLTLLKDGKTCYYIVSSDSNRATIDVTAVPGYTVSYRVDGGEYIPIENNRFYYGMPNKTVKLDIKYEATPITVSKLFADPVAVWQETYTKDNPLYDMRTIEISGDTTSYYGDARSYSLKDGSILPKGLRFEDGCIIGTPEILNEEGTEITVVIKGYNGSVQEIDLVISVSDDESLFEPVDSMIEVNYSSVYLKGTSVVILPDKDDPQLSTIYPDFNRDGMADRNTPFKLSNGSTKANFTYYEIIGYQDTTKPFDGDISITVRGGNLPSIQAVRGDANAKVVVNGKVSVNVLGGRSGDNAYNAVYVVNSGIVDHATLNVTGGNFKYSDFTAAYNSIVEENVNCTFRGDTIFTATGGSDQYKVYLSAADKCTVKGDVNVTLGVLSNTDSYMEHFNGVQASVIKGNMNIDYVGNWQMSKNRMLIGSTVEKNMNVTWSNGQVNYVEYACDNSTIKEELLVQVEKDAVVRCNNNTLLLNSTAKRIYVETDDDFSSNDFVVTIALEDNSMVKESAWVKIGNNYMFGGNCVIEEDITAKAFKLTDNAMVTIKEDVTVAVNTQMLNEFYIPETAALYNNGDLTINNTNQQSVYGRFDNKGTVVVENILSIDTKAMVLNRNMFSTNGKVTLKGIFWNLGTWNLAGELDNQNRIVNHGVLNQTYSGGNYRKLGKIVTSEALQLSKDIADYKNETSNKFYYAYKLQYPTDCVETVTVTGTDVISSDIIGDDKTYILADGTFTVNLSSPLKDVLPTSITYGSTQQNMVRQLNETWTGTGLYEPITINLNYDEQYITNISLDKNKDRIENSELSRPLVYQKTYSETTPLYDLTTVGILYDSEEGEVSYGVDNSSVLPKGLKFVNGKLFGTLESACDEEQDIIFTITGKNYTTAYFTLTLGKIDKLVPDFEIPGHLTGEIGEMLKDVELPYSEYGDFRWIDDTVSLGTVETTLEEVELQFVPDDVVNVDWIQLAQSMNLTYEEGILSFKVPVEVTKKTPIYEPLREFEATYGQRLKDVALPPVSNVAFYTPGKYTWKNPESKVGALGNHFVEIVFIPDDTQQYKKVTFSTKLVVKPAIPAFVPDITEAVVDCGNRLSSLSLPTSTNGSYKWITDSSIVPEDGERYNIGFVPKDKSNYDWTKVSGWDEEKNCVVFAVTVNIQHTPGEGWIFDHDNHWHGCDNAFCDAQVNKKEHTWVEDEIIEEATSTTPGTQLYVCRCGATKTESIPILGHTSHDFTVWNYDDTNHWKECSLEGCQELDSFAEHEWEFDQVIEEATQTQEGLALYVCECGKEKTESIDRILHTTHTFATNWSHDDKTHWHACTNPDCNEKDAVENHTFKEGEILVPATQSQDGTKKYICTECAYSYTQSYKAEQQSPGPNNGADANKENSEEKPEETLNVDDNFVDKKTGYTYTVHIKDKEVALTKVSKPSLKKFNVPGTVTYDGITYKVTVVGDGLFKNHKKLSEVTISSNVKKIGKKAFYGCKKLSKIKIGKGVEIIDESAFYNCTTLKKIEIPSKVNKIGKKAFYGCKKLYNVTIKTTKLTTNSIGKDAFKKMGSSNYKKVVVKVPKRKLTSYKKALKKRGLTAKAKIKK